LAPEFVVATVLTAGFVVATPLVFEVATFWFVDAATGLLSVLATFWFVAAGLSKGLVFDLLAVDSLSCFLWNQ
jgi:hypothetical protein